MAGLHELRGTTQTTSALRLHGSLSVALLRDAAALLQQKYPLLRATVGVVGERFHFLQPPVPAPAVVRQLPPRPDDAWQDRLEAELNDPLPPERSLWRLALVETRHARDQHLMLTCHHAIADGVSLVVLLRDLLGRCDDLLAGDRPDVAPLPMSEPIDALLAPASNRTDGNADAPPTPAHRCSAPLADRRTAVRFDTFGPTELERLLDAARQAGLTLNSLLAAGLIRAAAAVGLGESIRIHTAVSLRGRSARHGHPDAVGCYIGVAACDLHETAARPLLAVATDYQEQLRARVVALGHASPPVPLVDLRERLGRLARSAAFAQGIALTNHGRLHFPAYRRFRVAGYVNAACRNAGNFAVAVHATTWHNTLTLCFTYVVPLIEPERIAALRDAMRRALLASATREVPA